MAERNCFTKTAECQKAPLWSGRNLQYKPPIWLIKKGLKAGNTPHRAFVERKSYSFIGQTHLLKCQGKSRNSI